MRIYGPVPSRRFGLSLGVDIVPHKTCPLDCIYCQLGPTATTEATIQSFFSIEEILADVRAALAEGPAPDVITLAGSGEPGLYAHLQALIVALKGLGAARVLLITNGVMLTDEGMRKAALEADILAPSLDAGDEATFVKINKPHPSLKFDDIIEALRQTTWAHKGEVRLEVMLIKDINDDEASLNRLNDIIKTLRVDQIDLNTPVRPPVPERGALPCDDATLALACRIFGDKAQPIAPFAKSPGPRATGHRFVDQDKTVRETLFRRPCTRTDLMNSLQLSASALEQSLERLIAAGIVVAEPSSEGTFYRTISNNPTVRKHLLEGVQD